MPPKPKYDREKIIDIAVNLVREKGVDALTAREMAEYLGTSSRPIFTAFENMTELKRAVIDRCNTIYEEYCKREVAEKLYPEYKALGMAYIKLAKEESNIFKLLFMYENENEYMNLQYKSVINIVQKQTGLGEQGADRMHFEMWAFVHGIATMLATKYCELDINTISDCLSDVYNGLKWRIDDGKNN